MPTHYEHLTTPEIFETSYLTEDEQTYWNLVATLHKRGTETEFLMAKSFTESDNINKRCLGADTLGQLGYSAKNFQAESVQRLIELLDDEDNNVIASTAFALGHRADAKAVPYLLKHAQHPNDRTRFGITFGLLGQEDLRAIQALIQLTQDADFDIKNWATFGLASLCEVNTPELCDALLTKTEEDDIEIRGEALLGLALRKDERVRPKILQDLELEHLSRLLLESITAFPDTDYYEALLKISAETDLIQHYGLTKEFAAALLACTPTSL